MAATLDRVLRHLGGAPADAVTALYDRWAELVGDELATHTRPVALRDGVLVIGIDDPAWAPRLRFGENALRERLAEGLAGQHVRSIEVRVRHPDGA